MCTDEAALDRLSQLDQRFLDEANGRTVYLDAMHSVVDWFAYAIWTSDGTPRRSLSLSPGSGVIENLGTPLAFEAPYWADAKPVDGDEDDEDDDRYPLPFHPLEMAEDALRHLFGFNYEGRYLDNDPGHGTDARPPFDDGPLSACGAATTGQRTAARGVRIRSRCQTRSTPWRAGTPSRTARSPPRP